MKQKRSLLKAAAFLIEELNGENIVTPEDFSDEHHMIANTTEEFVVGEVLPLVDKLENHQFEHSVKLLEKAGDLGLLSADIPEEYGGLGLIKLVHH